jgi:hypothetical protein
MDDARNRFRIKLHPSRTLVLALGSAYIGAGACLSLLDLGSGIKTLVLAFLCFSGICDLYSHAGGNRRKRVKEIIFHLDGEWRVINAAGELLQGKPVGGRLLHPLAVSFSIRLGSGKRLPVFVLGDMCTADAFRDLRVWLGVHGERGQDAAARTRPLSRIGRGKGFRS